MTTDHLTSIATSAFLIHSAALADFLALRAAAACEGIAVEVASSFRSFERQRLIWQDKLSGTRPIWDEFGRSIIAPQALTPIEQLWKILRWSAIAGLSRHHWGSDLDLFDANTTTRSQLQLIPAEYECGGPCHKLDCWLTQNGHHFNFYRPYLFDRGGVAPERWHLSHAPTASRYEALLTPAQFENFVQQQDLPLKELIRERAFAIYHGYVVNTNSPIH